MPKRKLTPEQADRIHRRIAELILAAQMPVDMLVRVIGERLRQDQKVQR